MKNYPGRLGIQQRVLPSYRVPFFDELAGRCEGGLSIFAGTPLSIEAIKTVEELNKAEFVMAKNLQIADPSSPFYLCWQNGIVDWLTRWVPDSLIIEANPRYLSSLQAIRWMHHKGSPVIGWGLGVPRTGNRLERFLRHKFLNLLDGVIAYSNRGVKEYRQLGLTDVFLAYNTASPKPSWEEPKRNLEQTGPLTVLFVGRLQARKRVDLLIEACQRLPENSQPKLVIVGDGPVLDDLKSLAKEKYPKTLFEGAVYGETLETYFHKADIFVLPGTGGLAVQQAMSFGLPVIVAKGDGTQDDLVSDKNGWQVQPGNLDALIKVLEQALNDVSNLRRKGSESYRLVSEQINIDTMVDQFIEALTLTKIH